MLYKYYRICFGAFVSRDAFGWMMCNRSLGDATVHEQKWTSKLNEGMTRVFTQLILWLCLGWKGQCICCVTRGGGRERGRGGGK